MKEMTSFTDIISTTFEPNVVKVATSFIVTFAFFFGDIHDKAILAVAMLMVFDAITGVMAAWYEGKPITSRRFASSVRKGIVYFIGISAGYFTDQTMTTDLPLLDGHTIQAIMIAFIGVTEFSSILENMGRLGYETPKKLLNQLKYFKSKK